MAQCGYLQRLRKEGLWAVVTNIYVIPLWSQAAYFIDMPSGWGEDGGRYVPGNQSSIENIVSVKMCS